MLRRLVSPILSRALACGACLAADPALAEFPFPLSVVTPYSTDGSFGLRFGNVPTWECQKWVDGLAFQSGEALHASEISACEYAVTPVTPLPPGRYCLPPVPLSQELARCIEVTGQASDPKRGTVQVQLLYEGTGKGLSCHTCEGSGSQVCTRQERNLAFKVTLQDRSPELASAYTFAATFSTAPSQSAPAPEPETFRLLGTLAETYFVKPPPDAGEDVCATLHARRFGDEQIMALGTACLGPQGPREGPSLYFGNARCLGSHWRHWCDDNRADCVGPDAAKLVHCRNYVETCAEEPTAPPDLSPWFPQLAADAGPSADAALASTEDASAEDATPSPLLADASVSPRPSEAAVDCSAARVGEGRSARPWGLLLLAIPLLRRRRPTAV